MHNNVFPVFGTSRPERTLDSLTVEMAQLVCQLHGEPSHAHAASLMTLLADYRLTLNHKAHALQESVQTFKAPGLADAASSEGVQSQEESLLHGIFMIASDHGFEPGEEVINRLEA